MGIFNLSGNKLAKELRRTEKLHAAYTRQMDKLKELYYDTYSKETVHMIVDIVREEGHPAQVDMVNDFSKHYESGNFDEHDIHIYKKLLNCYSDKMLEKRNKEGS